MTYFVLAGHVLEARRSTAHEEEYWRRDEQRHDKQHGKAEGGLVYACVASQPGARKTAQPASVREPADLLHVVYRLDVTVRVTLSMTLVSLSVTLGSDVALRFGCALSCGETLGFVLALSCGLALGRRWLALTLRSALGLGLDFRRWWVFSLTRTLLHNISARLKKQWNHYKVILTGLIIIYLTI